MTEIAYVDSMVWVAILTDEAAAADVATVFQEVREGRGRILTSILTLTEISVRAYRDDPSRVQTGVDLVTQTASLCNVTPAVALLAARLEATYRTTVWGGDEGARRRRWDALHLATAAEFGATTFYTLDRRLLDADLSGIPKIPDRKRPLPLQGSIRFDANDR